MMTRHRALFWSFSPAAATLLAVLAPLPARAACDHPAGSWSRFAAPLGSKDAASLPELPNEIDAPKAGAKARRPMNPPSRSPNRPPPCVRCGQGDTGTPPGSSVHLERLDVWADGPANFNSLSMRFLIEPRDSLYAPEFDRSLDRPPRLA
jgi:hypothetical protein